MNNKDRKIAIIGGGAAGLMAALCAKKANADCKVTVFERLDRVGKKLLATGNGQCNLSNINANETVLQNGFIIPVHYHGSNPQFAAFALENFNVTDTVKFFENLGMIIKLENDKYYPYTLNASTVLDILRLYCEKLGVDFKLSSPVSAISKNKDTFQINNDDYDCLVIACGGKSSPHLGSDGSGYKLLENFEHKCNKLIPAITQVKTETELVKQLKGIKVDATASIYVNNNLKRCESGQVLFTEYGLSGPPILQISRIAAENYDKDTFIELDLMPEYNTEYIVSLITNIISNSFTNELKTDILLIPFMNKRLGQIIIKYCSLPLNLYAGKLSAKDITKIANAVKHLKFKVIGVQGFANAQVTAGGILTKDFDDKTMQSKLVRNLFAAGEILDIDGDCGGFNLQWAFSSGYLAGESAAKSEENYK